MSKQYIQRNQIAASALVDNGGFPSIPLDATVGSAVADTLVGQNGLQRVAHQNGREDDDIRVVQLGSANCAETIASLCDNL